MCLSNGINTATEIAGYCHYSVSTVHRLLQNLAELGWALQDTGSHKYFLGSLVSRLAADHASSHRFLVLHALREMNRLSDMTGETVMLGILEHLHFIQLYDIPSKQNLKITEEHDKLKGQYRGATARVLLSQLNDEELKELMKHIHLEQDRQQNTAAKKAMLHQVVETRRVGYAVSFGERIPDSGCVSVPVKNYFYPVALYIVGPESRLKPHVDTYLAELLASAGIISENIAEAFSR